jgi:predicted nucleotide-binding protein
MLGVSADMAYELLGGPAEQGQALVERAGFVGDLRDYESWKAARNEWIARTVETLTQIYPGSEEAERFSNAASTTGDGRWQLDYTRDLECTRAAVGIVTTLRNAVDPGDEPAADAGIAHEQSPEAEPGSDQPAGPEAGPGQTVVPAAGEEQSAAGDGAFQERTVTHEPGREQSVGSRADREQAQQERSRHPESQPAEEEPAQQEPGQEQAGRSELAPDLPARSGPALAPASGELGAQGPAGGNGLVRPSANGSAPPVPTTTPAGRKLDGSRQVFLVHGRNESVRQAVAQLLGRAGEHEVTTLNERPNDRKMLVEQFEREPAGARYAIVLLTADDVGAPRLDSAQDPYYSPRARQGVVFEMGFLVAALSPRCVCVLYEDGVELPCDLDGIAYIRLDLAGNWRSKLLLALRSAGFDYDLNSLAPA